MNTIDGIINIAIKFYLLKIKKCSYQSKNFKNIKQR